MFAQQATTLLEALRDLSDDKNCLTQRIEQLRDDLHNSQASSLETTVAELEYHFKLYSANNHPIEVAIADVLSTTPVTEDGQSISEIAARLSALDTRAEELFKQNALHGNKLGLVRDSDKSSTSSRLSLPFPITDNFTSSS